MDIVYLHGLKVDCVIGVWDWEKQIKQKLTIDLDMGFDLSRSAETDDLADTISYKDIANRVATFVSESKFSLVEKLGQSIADILINEFSIKWCRVKINKFGAVSGAGDVGIIIQREQKD